MRILITGANRGLGLEFVNQYLEREEEIIVTCRRPKEAISLVILDGTVGMEGMGPISGTSIKSNWVLASFDALAADSLKNSVDYIRKMILKLLASCQRTS